MRVAIRKNRRAGSVRDPDFEILTQPVEQTVRPEHVLHARKRVSPDAAGSDMLGESSISTSRSPLRGRYVDAQTTPLA